MLNANRIGNALGLTFAALYTLCSLLTVVWPQGYTSATAMLVHGFVPSVAPAMSFMGFVLGVLCITILGYIIGALYSVIWNALAGDRNAVPVPVSVQPSSPAR